MARAALRVGVVARSYPPVSVWGGRVLRPFAVLPDLPDLSPGTQMSAIGGIETVYLGDHALVLYSGETGHYRSNLSAARPSVWVALDGAQVLVATVDPHEGESLASDPGRVVEAVPMPDPVQAALQAFVAAHHVEEVFVKRKRKPAAIQTATDPRAPRVLRPEQKWGHKILPAGPGSYGGAGSGSGGGSGGGEDAG